MRGHTAYRPKHGTCWVLARFSFRSKSTLHLPLPATATATPDPSDQRPAPPATATKKQEVRIRQRQPLCCSLFPGAAYFLFIGARGAWHLGSWLLAACGGYPLPARYLPSSPPPSGIPSSSPGIPAAPPPPGISPLLPRCEVRRPLSPPPASLDPDCLRRGCRKRCMYAPTSSMVFVVGLADGIVDGIDVGSAVGC
jgi:hypothetical protein